jgi:cytochrome P450
MISQMPYLDAVIKESMRLYPVAPFVVRKLTSDITIPPEVNVGNENRENGATMPATAARTTSSGGTTLSSSTFACIWIYALHRNPKLWHSPDDFLPERWIDPQLKKKDSGQEEPGAYIPFAMGPRNCLGRPLAQVILRVLLARIIRKYMVVDPRYEALEARLEKNDVVDAKSLRKDMQAGFTVLPSNGLMVRFVERE